jgi:hypothetical protein
MSPVNETRITTGLKGPVYVIVGEVALFFVWWVGVGVGGSKRELYRGVNRWRPVSSSADGLSHLR